MKIKLDENLPSALVYRLQALGHEVDTVPGEHLTGCNDEEVWLAAQRDERFLITQDLDFSDIRRYKPGTHMGLCSFALRTLAALPWRNALRRYSALKPLSSGAAASLLPLSTKCA